MITREQAREQLFYSELYLARTINPRVDVEKFRRHWEKSITEQDIDWAWEVYQDFKNQKITNP